MFCKLLTKICIAFALTSMLFTATSFATSCHGAGYDACRDITSENTCKDAFTGERKSTVRNCEWVSNKCQANANSLCTL